MSRSSRLWYALPALTVAGAYISYEIYSRWRRKHIWPTARDVLLKESGVCTYIVESVAEWEEVEPLISADIAILQVVGFDLEWVSLTPEGLSCLRPASLMQIATHTGRCVLVRIHKLEKVPESLKSLLRNKGILKVGVACHEDGVKLHKDYGLCVRGTVDLRYLALRDRYTHYRRGGLAALTSLLLGLKLDKDPSIRRSDWEREPLTQTQIEYAALDALVGIRIFMVLVKNRLGCHNPDASEEQLWQKALSACQGVVDVKYKNNYSRQSPEKEASTSKPKLKTPANSSKNVTRAYMVRTKPLYHNCQLLAPDEQLLCTCDLSKAEWYIEKGLGVKVKDDPLTVKLTFEPSGRPISERNYYLQEKNNVCVVCGSSDSYIRKNIIPHEYRKYFPSVMKDHKSHDVVLMCTPCHQRSGQYDSLLRQDLADRADAPLGNNQGKYMKDEVLARVKSAAKALLLSSSQLPEERRIELEATVTEYYGGTPISLDLLQEATAIDFKVPLYGYTPHGEKVVQYFMENEGLVEFERMWREHFIASMEPKFMPDMWSVDHSHDRLQLIATDMTAQLQESSSSLSVKSA